MFSTVFGERAKADQGEICFFLRPSGRGFYPYPGASYFLRIVVEGRADSSFRLACRFVVLIVVASDEQ